MEALSQPLWSTVLVAPFEERTAFRFLRSADESTNDQLQGALPYPQSFILEGFELRVYGSYTARELVTAFPLSRFHFRVADRDYSNLPLGAILWSGAPEFQGARLEKPLLLYPQVHFSATIYWSSGHAGWSISAALPVEQQKRFKLTLTLFLVGVLLRPVA